MQVDKHMSIMEDEELLHELLADSDSEMSSETSDAVTETDDSEGDCVPEFSAKSKKPKKAKPDFRRGWSEAGPTWRQNAPVYTGRQPTCTK